MEKKFDFSGWATRNNLKCSDGRTIRKDAFKDNDGKEVPLVWMHCHDDPNNVLGHALLENRPEGVYAYCSFNDSEKGKTAKELVNHGDIKSLSIWANQLKQNGGDVLHGLIREVSLVMAGANPGAFIDAILVHGEISDEEAIIGTGENEIPAFELAHAESNSKPAVEIKKEDTKVAEPERKLEKEETVQEVFDTLDEKQKTVVYAIIGQAVEDAKGENEDDSEGGEETMKHNVFEDSNGATNNENILSHSDMKAIFSDVKRYGSLKESVIQHGITNIDYLFPDAKTLNTPPDFIAREMSWVKNVMGNVHHTPFSRIKSIFANITADDARAKGYVKGNLKIEEVFSLLKRTTTPQTVYKKQKFDRDDIIDITDFDVVAWTKGEMRIMLDEELARAYLIGDGRLPSSDDKIDPTHIRPIWTDDDMYTIKQVVNVANGATDADKAKEFIRQAIKSRKNYKGSGNPTFYTTEDILTDCLLLTDTTGRDLYDSVDKLATKIRAKEIITVPVMENQTRTVDGTTRTLMGIMVNLDDYNVGADKGGAVNMFDDFDIDYNAEKYLIETRCSAALTKPYSAIAFECVVADPT